MGRSIGKNVPIWNQSKIFFYFFAIVNLAYLFPSPFKISEKKIKGWKALLALDEEEEDEDKTFCRVSRAYVTPLGVRCADSRPELANRVLRHYWDVRDRFLRVNFCDEALDHLPSDSDLLQRVKEAFVNGITVCGRKYEPLAFSANQVSEFEL